MSASTCWVTNCARRQMHSWDGDSLVAECKCVWSAIGFGADVTHDAGGVR